jgi:putative membrane protein
MADPSVQGAPGLDIATQLMYIRTLVAYERTMLAWIRTATSLITFGLSIYKFWLLFDSRSWSRRWGTTRLSSFSPP